MDPVERRAKRQKVTQETASTLTEVQQWNISQVIDVLNAIDKVEVEGRVDCPWVTSGIYFERSVYKTLMDCIAEFITSKPKSVRIPPVFMILGTPGVGKTLFLIHAVKSVCKEFEDGGVVYITSEAPFSITRDEAGIYTHSQENTIPAGALVICDISNRHMLPRTLRLDCQMIISSSVGQYYSARTEFEWLKRTHWLGMDTWTYDELSLAFAGHKLKDQVLKGFQYCGGSFRTLLYETPCDTDFDTHHVQRIQRELQMVTSPTQIGPGQTESMIIGFYNLFHFRWTRYQTDARIRWYYVGYWATNFVQQQVAEKYLTLSRAQTNALIGTAVGGIEGKLFEEGLHIKMAKKEPLLAKSENGVNLTIQCDSFHYFVLGSNTDGKKEILRENVWYRPTQGNFGTADALVLMDIGSSEKVLCGIQSTISPEHDDMKEEHIIAFLSHCPKETKKYYHVFYSLHGVREAKKPSMDGIQITIYNHCTIKRHVMSDQYFAEAVAARLRQPKHMMTAWLEKNKEPFTGRDNQEILFAKVANVLMRKGILLSEEWKEGQRDDEESGSNEGDD